MLLFLIKCYGGVSCTPVPERDEAVRGFEKEHAPAQAAVEPALTTAVAEVNGASRSVAGDGPAVLRAMSEWRRRLVQHGGGALMFRRHALLRSYRSGDVEVERAAGGGVPAAVVERLCADACATAPRSLKTKSASAGEIGGFSQMDDLRAAIRDMVARDFGRRDDEDGGVSSPAETWHWSAADCVGPSVVGSFTGRVQPCKDAALGPAQPRRRGVDGTAAAAEAAEGVCNVAFPVFRHASASGWKTEAALEQVGGFEQLMTDIMADELGVSAAGVHWMVSCITDLLLAAAAESPDWVLEDAGADARQFDGASVGVGRPRLRLRNEALESKSDLLRHLYKLHARKLHGTSPSGRPRQYKRHAPAFTEPAKEEAGGAGVSNLGDAGVDVQHRHDQNPSQRRQRREHQHQGGQDEELEDPDELGKQREAEGYDGESETVGDERSGVDPDELGKQKEAEGYDGESETVGDGRSGVDVDDTEAKSRKRKRQQKREDAKMEKKRKKEKKEKKKEKKEKKEKKQNRDVIGETEEQPIEKKKKRKKRKKRKETTKG